MIKKITGEEANIIIDTGEPKGLFYLIDNGVYVGIDNTTRDAWIEEFETKEECFKWLNGDDGEEKYKYKNDKDKPRLDLVPPGIIEAVGIIRTYGVEKYGENTNWEKVEESRYRAALIRHLCKYLRDPLGVDEESGYPHLWHMACNIAFLCELDRRR